MGPKLSPHFRSNKYNAIFKKVKENKGDAGGDKNLQAKKSRDNCSLGCKKTGAGPGALLTL
jgi:hypothetical protein